MSGLLLAAIVERLAITEEEVLSQGEVPADKGVGFPSITVYLSGFRVIGRPVTRRTYILRMRQAIEEATQQQEGEISTTVAASLEALLHNALDRATAGHPTEEIYLVNAHAHSADGSKSSESLFSVPLGAVQSWALGDAV
jgi:hypothetical protein